MQFLKEQRVKLKGKDLKKLNTSAKIGVAHNGIIGLTTSYRRDVDYSDTMEFITKYLSLMIKDWSYYKDHNILTLIERLIDSKMCLIEKSYDLIEYITQKEVFDYNYEEQRKYTSNYLCVLYPDDFTSNGHILFFLAIIKSI